MNIATLLDPASAAIVLGGTALATLLRCGPGDCAMAFAGLRRSSFDAVAARSELALQIQDIRKDGLLRAPAHHCGDSEFDEATDALIGTRSITALLAAHESHKARRIEASNRGARTLAQAAELAPVFGLAGTLISLSQMPTDGIARGAYAGAIGMAVLTTLYGLLLANIVLAPLARLVERGAQAEETARQALVDWLAAQVAPELAKPHAHARMDRAA